MADYRLVRRVRRGTASWNKWRASNPFVIIDLSGANLAGIDLTGADLSFANMNGANLSKARLVNARLQSAFLNDANLGGADLRRVDLAGAQFSEANLVLAKLAHVRSSQPGIWTSFYRAVLQSADFKMANLPGVNFNEANLSRAHLVGATLMPSSFQDANLTRTDLTRAVLCGAELRRAHVRLATLHRVDLSRANLMEADFFGVDLTRAQLQDAHLEFARLVHVDLRRADLSASFVHGVSAWDVQLARATQSNLTISYGHQPQVTVSDLRVAHLVYLLFQDHAQFRNVLDNLDERGVLLLGPFRNGGLAFLQALAAALRRASYLPMSFDFERLGAQNYTETIVTLAGLSKFVVAEVTGPSVPQELDSIVHLKTPIVPIVPRGTDVYSLLRDLQENPWVAPVVEYDGPEHLLELLPSHVIAKAERMHHERQTRLDRLYS